MGPGPREGPAAGGGLAGLRQAQACEPLMHLITEDGGPHIFSRKQAGAHSFQPAPRCSSGRVRQRTAPREGPASSLSPQTPRLQPGPHLSQQNSCSRVLSKAQLQEPASRARARDSVPSAATSVHVHTRVRGVCQDRIRVQFLGHVFCWSRSDVWKSRAATLAPAPLRSPT